VGVSKGIDGENDDDEEDDGDDEEDDDDDDEDESDEDDEADSVTAGESGRPHGEPSLHNAGADEETDVERNINTPEGGEEEMLDMRGDSTQEGLVLTPREPYQLQNNWCLYLMTPNSGGKQRDKDTWTDQQLLVHEFSTVEEFWCMYNNIHYPSEIGFADYSLFKKGILPAWEDPICMHGGRWLCKLPPKYKTLDEIWLHLVLAMIGENFEHGDKVCGSVVSARARATKVALWISTGDEREARKIGLTFLDLLNSKAEKRDCCMTFERFSDNRELMKLDSSDLN